MIRWYLLFSSAILSLSVSMLFSLDQGLLVYLYREIIKNVTLLSFVFNIISSRKAQSLRGKPKFVACSYSWGGGGGAQLT